MMAVIPRTDFIQGQFAFKPKKSQTTKHRLRKLGKKGRKFMVKEIKLKNIGNIISEKEFGGSLRLKFGSLCVKFQKNPGTLAGKESFSNILEKSK